MKQIKTFVSVLLLTAMLLVQIFPLSSAAAAPRMTVADPVDETQVRQRIEELRQILDSTKDRDGHIFFTKNHRACRVPAVKKHGCYNCRISNVISAPWFREAFKERCENLHVGQLTGDSASCVGFAFFAQWYLFHTATTDQFLQDENFSGSYPFDKETVAKLVRVGDYLFLDGHHAVVVTEILDNGIMAMQSNYFSGAGQPGNCAYAETLVRYSQHSKMGISRAANYATDGLLLKDGIYTISPKCAPNSCIDIQYGGTDNGASVMIWEKHGKANQQFMVKHTEDNLYEIISVSGQKPLDVIGANPISGTKVQQYEKNNTAAQKWRIQSAGDGYYNVVSALDSNLYLDVGGGESKNGVPIQIYENNGTDAQKFKFDYIAAISALNLTSSRATVNTGNYYTLKNIESGKMLNVFKNRSADGTNITVYQEDGTTGQAFSAVSLTNGFYMIPQCAPNSAVNVYGSSSKNGSNITVWQQTKNPTQLWNAYYNAELNGFHILSVDNPDLALAENGTGNSSNVCLKKFDTNDRSQVWTSEMFTVK